MSKPEPAGRLQRWALKMQEYDMKIGYRPGKSHQNADCLSRIPKNLGAIPKNPNKGGSDRRCDVHAAKGITNSYWIYPCRYN
jgi:hypothetical protein